MGGSADGLGTGIAVIKRWTGQPFIETHNVRYGWRMPEIASTGRYLGVEVARALERLSTLRDDR